MPNITFDAARNGRDSKVKFILVLTVAGFALAGCANETPEQKHEVGCIAGSLTGAVAGGMVGSLIGGGTGKVIATTVGTLGGAAVGNSLSCG